MGFFPFYELSHNMSKGERRDKESLKVLSNIRSHIESRTLNSMFICQQKEMLCCKMLGFGWSGRTDAFKSIRRISSTVATVEGNLVIQLKLNYQAFNHRTSYVIQEYDACTELRSINSSVGSEKILHLCIEGKSIVSNAIARTVTWFETGQVKCWTLFISLNWVPQERTVEKQTSSVKMVWATAMTNDKSFLKAIDYVSLMLYDDV